MRDPLDSGERWFEACHTLDELQAFLSSRPVPYEQGVSAPSVIAGRCGVCAGAALFLVESKPGEPVNWRETLRCTGCGLFARWRACLHLLETLDAPSGAAVVYLTEATSLFFDAVRSRYPKATGSEFDPGRPPGKRIRVSGRLARNEDVTRLTFDDGTFSHVICQDVLEHVPDYAAALRELCRVLKPGGSLYLTVPFTFSDDTLVRAELADDGEVVHHLPPMYHLDPANPDGSAGRRFRRRGTVRRARSALGLRRW